MNRLPVPGLHAPAGLLGMVRSWLRDRSAGSRPASGPRAAEAGWPAAMTCGSVRVLVVDDNSLNLTLMSGLMASRGLVPLLATNGSEAVALACGMQFDLILMDLRMPVLNGFEATAAIRHFEATSGRLAVPIVAHSRMAFSERVLAAHGIHGSLAKPCAEDDLEACLLRWCPGYRAQPHCPT